MSRGRSVNVGWRTRARLAIYAEQNDMPMASIMTIAARKHAGSVEQAHDLHDRATVGRRRRRRPTGGRVGRSRVPDGECGTVFASADAYALLVLHAGRLRVTIAALAEHVLIELMRHPLSDDDAAGYTRVRIGIVDVASQEAWGSDPEVA